MHQFDYVENNAKIPQEYLNFKIKYFSQAFSLEKNKDELIGILNIASIQNNQKILDEIYQKYVHPYFEEKNEPINSKPPRKGSFLSKFSSAPKTSTGSIQQFLGIATTKDQERLNFACLCNQTDVVITLVVANPTLAGEAFQLAANFDKPDVINKLAMQENLIRFIDAKDSKGATPLHTAILKNQRKAVEALLLKGANIQEKNNDGKTAIELLAAQPDKDFVVFCIKVQEACIFSSAQSAEKNIAKIAFYKVNKQVEFLRVVYHEALKIKNNDIALESFNHLSKLPQINLVWNLLVDAVKSKNAKVIFHVLDYMKDINKLPSPLDLSSLLNTIFYPKDEKSDQIELRECTQHLLFVGAMIDTKLYDNLIKESPEYSNKLSARILRSEYLLREAFQQLNKLSANHLGENSPEENKADKYHISSLLKQAFQLDTPHYEASIKLWADSRAKITDLDNTARIDFIKAETKELQKISDRAKPGEDNDYILEDPTFQL